MPSRKRSVRSRARQRAFLFRFLALYVALLSGILLLAALEAYTASAAPAYQTAGEGQTIFQAKCAGCHSIGGGKLVGPDLKDVTARRTPDWLKRFISNPAGMIASDPDAKKLSEEFGGMTMPTIALSATELDAVLAYLANPGGGPAAPPVQPAVGNPAAGSLLFTGETRLANGAPACIACHSAGSAGALGGGALGPDLTHVVTRLGEPGVAASLQNIVFPTMAGPFLNHPLTPQEQADLVAFLRETDLTQPPVPAATAGALTMNAFVVFAIGLAGTGLLFGLLFYVQTRQKQHQRVQLPARKR